jgi:hypothetical protein
MPGAPTQLQGSSPTHSSISDLDPDTEVSGVIGSNGRSEDQEESAYMRESNDERPGEQSGGQSLNEAGNPGEQMMEIDRGSKNGASGEQSTHRRGSSNEGMEASVSTGDGLVDEPASQWLKSLLPEVSGGWWDVYPRDNGFAVRFRWRDQGRQTLAFPQISNQCIQDLMRGAPDDTRRLIFERITDNLQRFLLDPEKRDKALLVARKLGIDTEDLESPTTTN